MSKEITDIKEIQSYMLENLKIVSRICDANNLKYWLMYGTLIGAIRSKGFIPWDDDLDIMMPREDYDKFINLIINDSTILEPFELINVTTNSDYIYGISRVSNPKFSLDYYNASNYGLGIFIDIYPMDGFGKSKRSANRWRRKMKRIIRCIGYAGVENHIIYDKFPKIIFQKVFSLYFHNRLALPYINKINKIARKRKIADCNYVGCTVWEKTIFQKEWFEKLELVYFEDSQFYIPSDYDKILRFSYGDYMKLPPKEDRIGHHNYKVYLKDDDI